MSRVRGVLPLFLATTFGIINGVWVFGPALREQQQEKDELAREALEVSRHFEEAGVETLRDAEAAASGSVATNFAVKPVISSGSWWSKMSLWPEESDGKENNGRLGDNTANQKTKK